MSEAATILFSLLGRFERGPDDDPNCRLTPEGAALDAYLCPADKWTLSFGCTFHPDGTPVKQGDTITPDQVFPYVEAAVARVRADVARLVTRPLNPYQEAAVCSFVFNLGGKNLAKSTKLLPAINEGRWEDAAEAMGEFIRAWGKREGKWHRKVLLGLLIRRYAEGCTLIGLDFTDACTEENIGLPRKTVWQPDWVDPDGIRTGGRYFDEVQPGKTEFTAIEAIARATPLPPLASHNAGEAIASKPEPAPSVVLADAGQPAKPPSPPPAAPATQSKPAAPSSPSVAAGPAVTKTTAAPQPSLPPVPLPTKPPRLPDPPVPIGQQTSAVDGTRNANEWSSSPKAMILSRRFWGLMLIIVGRLWLLKSGSTAVLGAVSDPLVMEMFGGVMVMIIGEMIQHVGKVKATRLLT